MPARPPRILAWIGLALCVVLPRGGLTGHPDVDVWNHAWGLWWVAHQLAEGHLPWHTTLVGAPGGGVLYFIDPLGALVTTPITWAFGPQVAYEVLLVGRVALAGAAAQALAEEAFGEGAHGWFAGVAYATTPLLLCELHNGITEVAAVWWTPAVLWAALRAWRGGGARVHLGLGLLLGLSVWGNFYYGLVHVLAVGAWWAAGLLLGLRGGGAGLRARALGLALAAGMCAAVAAPCAWALRASVQSEEALVSRPVGLNRELAHHNAVDPRNYLVPGDFWSVDLPRRYGEAFRHTGQLRVSVWVLAAVGVLRSPRRRAGWAALALGSLVLGLGPQLFWTGRFPTWGGAPAALPFAWLQALVPGLAITHPQRLSIVAQAVVCVLAASALVGRGPRWVAGLAALAAAETALGSLACWPLVESPATVPALYHEIADDPDVRAVLDLPGDSGTTMATSRYFWYQTVHHKPVPYKPDARGHDTGDPVTFARLPSRFVPAPAPFDEASLTALRATYGWVVVHPGLGPDADAQAAVFEAALGPPEARDGLLVWRVAPAD